MRVVFAAARSAPGVTTSLLACASVWPDRVLLVEAADDGGVLAARFGLPAEPGLTTLAAATRHHTRDAGSGANLVAAHTQPLPGTGGRITALVGPPSPGPAQTLLRSAAGRLADLLAEPDGMPVVLIDAGRLALSPLAAPLIATADRLLLVARPRLEELQTLAHRLAPLTTLGPPPELLLVGDKPYGPREVAATLGVPVVGVVAHDPAAADALAAATRPRGLARSLLLRSAASLVDRLTTGPAPDPASPAPRLPGHNGRPRRAFTASSP